jgi:predicted GIY-YIG superfamily endonuclease
MEEQPDRKTALKREIAIKRLGRDGKKKLIVKSIQGSKEASRQGGK